MDNKILLLTSKANRSVYSTEHIGATYDWIIKNQDARIREVDYTGKPKIINKHIFLTRFLKFTKDKNKFFALARFMITERSNFVAFLSSIEMLEEWNEFKNEIK